MNIDRTVNFPFPTPPEEEALRAAEKLLVLLGALNKTSKKITKLGRLMSTYPVSPRYAKMLCVARRYNVLPHIIAVVASLTVRDVLLTGRASEMGLEDDDESVKNVNNSSEGSSARHQDINKAREQWKLEGIKGGSDLAANLCAIGACDFVGVNSERLFSFCSEHFIRHKAIIEISKLRLQLSKTGLQYIGSSDEEDAIAVGTSSSGNDKIATQLTPPSNSQRDAIRQIVLSGLGDNVARVCDHTPEHLTRRGVYAYTCSAVEEPVYIHPDSVFYRQCPGYLVYHGLVQGKTKLYMKDVSIVQPEWLPKLVPGLCSFGKPLDSPAPYYSTELDEVRCWLSGTFGPRRWALRPSDLPFPDGPDRYRYFARFLLEGIVCPQLLQYVDNLKNKPEIMNKPWVKERVVAVLQPLVEGQIDSRAKLLVRWKTEPTFLLHEYALWLDPAHHAILASQWPPI